MANILHYLLNSEAMGGSMRRGQKSKWTVIIREGREKSNQTGRKGTRTIIQVLISIINTKEWEMRKSYFIWWLAVVGWFWETGYIWMPGDCVSFICLFIYLLTVLQISLMSLLPPLHPVPIPPHSGLHPYYFLCPSVLFFKRLLFIRH